MSKLESDGRLIFVDWYSRFTKRVTSIDVSGNVLKVSNDLTNLAVGIDMALKMASNHTHVRLVLEMASPTIITEGFDRVHEFLNSVRAKLKNHSCTGLVLLNPLMHPEEETRMLEEIFDGTMLIERTELHGRFQSTFRVAHLSGTAYSPARLNLSITQRGMEISGSGDTQPLVIDYDHGDEKAILGLLGIESLSPGGLPVGHSFLVWIPSSMVPSDYVKPVVMEAQKEGNALLLALSSMDTDTIGEWMSEKGLSRKGLIDRGLLQVVEWYGQKSAKVFGMEMDQGVIRTSRDLTHLGVGLDTALSKISDQFSSLAVMELLSQAIRLFDMGGVYAFAQSINAKLVDRNFTTFVLMERDAHESMINAAFEELFDGIIDIRTSGGVLEIGLVSIRGCHFQSEYRPLTKLRDRLTIDVSRRVPDSEIVETMATHGLSARLKSLEKELGSTLEEKLSLERRLAELMEKATEYERRHREMKSALEVVEGQMAKSAEASGDISGVQTQHREELAKLLKIMDDMLENLPDDVVNSFAASEDFKLYEKILNIYLEEKE
ncbi:MAG: hypothetical protein KKH41_09660 [Candidatus Thermoplasmatota archaeon]|nr:hypothetical protein [Candidatus Thermoplasmatota archaeon]MBU4071598.1 hypothetical protein [Candidatus Thermoplasmatota archaeon]MBU4144358.1 hypothetical protein [Candidatus Thermoplasmatota archaeon]MBU4592830.1 hypothetical protein [Candidatus Thermoplasmatota archaeon]